MRVDLYTKAVLTVIAACLVYMCFERTSVIPTVTAQAKPEAASPPQEVVIVGWKKAPGEKEPVFSLLNKDLPFRTADKPDPNALNYSVIVGWAAPNQQWIRQGVADLNQRGLPVRTAPR